MHLFVATTDGQGDHADDFSHTVDGELIRFAFDACDCPGCGCERAVAGLSSSRATTTFTVRDAPGVTLSEYTRAIRDALLREGWLEEGEDDAWVADLAKLQAGLAADLEPGIVLRVNGRSLVVHN